MIIGYLVNSIHVTRVRRFNVLMADGTDLPIPKKKYTAFKKGVNEYWDKSHASGEHAGMQQHDE